MVYKSEDAAHRLTDAQKEPSITVFVALTMSAASW
jgi:hypothetical protein